MENEDIAVVNEVLKKKVGILPKKLHTIKLTHHDLLRNLKNKDKAMIDIVKNAVILYGQEIYVEIVKDVASL